MALSKQVQDSLDEAQANLRNALAFAARNEEPYISKHIADLMHSIDNIKHVTNLMAISDKVIKQMEEED
jgi:hypothetical protein